jgi:hypothetical protein
MKLILPLLLMSLLTIFSGCSRPTEGDLLARFEAHKSAFGELAALAVSDPKLNRLTEDRVEPANVPIDADKVTRYRSLFRKLGIRDGMLRRFGYEGTAFFLVRTKGLPSGGSMFGYAFCTTEPTSLVEQIYPEKQQGRGIIFRKIEDGWFLFFSNEG